MSIYLCISPYLPSEAVGTKDCFRIELDDYRVRLAARWGQIRFLEPGEGMSLFWQMPSDDPERSGPLLTLGSDLQSVTCGGLYHRMAEFIHWHRALIDSECSLYFYVSFSSHPAEITSELSVDDIQKILEDQDVA